MEEMRIELPEPHKVQQYRFDQGVLVRGLLKSFDWELIARLDRGEVLEIGGVEEDTEYLQCCADGWRNMLANDLDRAMLDWSQDAGPQEPLAEIVAPFEPWGQLAAKPIRFMEPAYNTCSDLTCSCWTGGKCKNLE